MIRDSSSAPPVARDRVDIQLDKEELPSYELKVNLEKVR
jgi:hypothetical protein